MIGTWFATANFVKMYLQMFNFVVVMSKGNHHSLRHVENHTTFPVGYEFESNGVLLRCIERPYVASISDACKGCYFGVNNLTCPKSQCSVFGRTDGKDVWFVEVSDISKR